MPLRMSNYREFKMNDLLSESSSMRIIFLDEIQTIANSRSSFDFSNNLLSYGTSQRRKSNTILMYTLPLMRKLDIDLREESDLVFYCNRINIPPDRPNEGDFYYIVENKNSGEFSDFTITYDIAKQFFNLFDTSKKITNKKVIEIANKSTLFQNYDAILEKMSEYLYNILTKYSIQLTHDFVSYFVRNVKNLGHDSQFEKDLYILVKNRLDLEGKTEILRKRVKKDE